MYYEIEDESGNISTVQLRERGTGGRARALQAGDFAGTFYIKSEDGFPVAAVTGYSVSNDSRSLIELVKDRALVLTFYCTCWGCYAPKYLAFLQEITPQIEALGGQLLVLTNESPYNIERMSRKLNVDLAIFHDKDNHIARSYGVYSEASPIWDRIAGISEDVFTPALFVIGKDRRVSYAFVDENFDSLPHGKTILREIYEWKDRK